MELLTWHRAAALKAPPAAGRLDQNASHRFSCDGEEMRAPFELRTTVLDHPEPRFMNERRRLESVPSLFLGHFIKRHPSKLVVDQRKQLLRGISFAPLDGFQNSSDVTHAGRIQDERDGMFDARPPPVGFVLRVCSMRNGFSA